MARTRHNLADLFVALLQPVTDAIRAETGRRVSGAEWVRIGRTLAARALRAVAEYLAPTPAVEPVAPAPVPAPVPAPEVPAGPPPELFYPAPVAVVAIPAPESAPVPISELDPAPSKHARKPRKPAAPKAKAAPAPAPEVTAPAPTKAKATKPRKATPKATPAAPTTGTEKVRAERKPRTGATASK